MPMELMEGVASVVEFGFAILVVVALIFVVRMLFGKEPSVKGDKNPT